MSEPEHSAVEKALDVVVYAPLGVAMFARDTVPTFLRMFVTRGRTEFEQRRRGVEHQVNQARTIGVFAVKFGGPEVRRRVEDGVATARARAEETVAGFVVGRDSGGDAPITRSRPTATASSRASNANGDGRARGPSVVAPPGPPVGALPIPDYDELSASQVVERLVGLDPDDLATVRAYESAHRSRRTILGKIAQLAP